MPARTEVKIAFPPSQPNRLLLVETRPPPDSTTEILGRRRQSKLWRSAARRNSAESSLAGQSDFWKKFFKLWSLGSFLYSAAAPGTSVFVTATGTERIPASIRPLEINRF